MPKMYSPSEKRAALDRLRTNGGDVALTSAETGIPTRTLYSWRRASMRTPAASPFLTPPESIENLDPADADSLVKLRQYISYYLTAAAPFLIQGLDMLTPYQRALTVRQMLEQLRLIDDLIPAHMKEHTFRVEYVNPDGTVSDQPFWMLDSSDPAEDPAH